MGRALRRHAGLDRSEYVVAGNLRRLQRRDRGVGYADDDSPKILRRRQQHVRRGEDAVARRFDVPAEDFVHLWAADVVIHFLLLVVVVEFRKPTFDGGLRVAEQDVETLGNDFYLLREDAKTYRRPLDVADNFV